MEGMVGTGGAPAAPGGATVEAAPAAAAPAKRSWARVVLMALFVAHGTALLIAVVRATPDVPLPAMTFLFGALNALALAGVATRTRAGFWVALAFVVAAVARYAWLLQIEEADYPGLIVGIAAAVFCLTDPALRREHGLTA